MFLGQVFWGTGSLDVLLLGQFCETGFLGR